MRKLFIPIFFILILLPFSYAQSTNLQPLWDAIADIQNAILALQNDVHTIQTVGLQFAQETNTRLNNLEQQTSLITTLGTQFALDTNNSINALRANDENLQQQINALPTTPTSSLIARNKIYEVAATLNTHEALCNDSDDVMLNAYCIGGYGEIAPLNQIVFDNFDDGDFTVNPSWNIISGSFVVGAAPSGPNKLVVNTGGISEIVTQSVFTSVPLKVETDITTNNGGAQMMIAVTDNSSAALSGNGYMLGYFDTYNGSPSLVFYKIANGTFTNPVIIPNVYWAPQQEMHFSMERDVTGNWIFGINGINYATGYADSNFTSFAFTHLRYAATPADAGAYDNVRVQNGDSNVLTTAFVNINDYNSPMGIRCLNNGSARVMCLQQP